MSKENNNIKPIKLKSDRTLIIHGDQGSGKTTLAIASAKAHGSYSIVAGAAFTSPFWLCEAMANNPDTVIINEISIDKNLSLVKTIATEKVTMVQCQYQKPREIKTPNFIFCTGKIDPHNPIKSDRRFFVVGVKSDQELMKQQPPSWHLHRSAEPFDKGCSLQLELETEIINLLENDGGHYSKNFDLIEANSARRKIAGILGLKLNDDSKY